MSLLVSNRERAHHLRMTAIGFLVGCVVALPSAVLLSGRAGFFAGSLTVGDDAPPKLAIGSSHAPAVLPVSTPKADSAPPSAGPVPTARTVKTHRIEVEPSEFELAEKAQRALEEKVETARALLSRGQVERAREIIYDDRASPEAAFVLAETYDPNVLASLNLQNVRAEVERARRLYSQALVGGIVAARKRLEGLQ